VIPIDPHEVRKVATFVTALQELEDKFGMTFGLGEGVRLGTGRRPGQKLRDGFDEVRPLGLAPSPYVLIRDESGYLGLAVGEPT
jgi:hypothetical protein